MRFKKDLLVVFMDEIEKCKSVKNKKFEWIIQSLD